MAPLEYTLTVTLPAGSRTKPVDWGSAPGPGTGLTPAGWLHALAEAAIEAMRADLANDGKEWPRLWAFCCGLADEEVGRNWKPRPT